MYKNFGVLKVTSSTLYRPSVLSQLCSEQLVRRIEDDIGSFPTMVRRSSSGIAATSGDCEAVRFL
ncbi:hypothetical protein Ciccas_013142 [Cichlidogyrus casuarinus]|uniref:Uncharacterized protein n=1 Tax=Cichlidogyrus casuarinus TaxID=1844966 RepID=A0ABD2PMT9_9PLAT